MTSSSTTGCSRRSRGRTASSRRSGSTRTSSTSRCRRDPAAGQATTVDWRPQIASYTVETQATTVDASGSTELQVTEPTPGHIVVTGHDRRRIRSPPGRPGDHRSVGVRPHGVHRGAATSGCHGHRRADRTEPDGAAARRRQLPGRRQARRARVGVARRLRAVDHEGQLQPRRRPDDVPRRGQGRQHRLRPGHRRRGRPVHRARCRQEVRVPVRRRRLQRPEPGDASRSGHLLPERRRARRTARRSATRSRSSARTARSPTSSPTHRWPARHG